MTRVQFDALVERLEGKFYRHGERLKRTSLIWAVMGYIVLTIYVFLCLGLTAGCIWLMVEQPGAATIKLGIFLGIAAGALSLSIIRSLWISLTAPEGREVTREEAPQLFAMIDSISHAAGGVVFHKVLLTDELNASVVQVARAGVFGFYRNYLSLGVPLLDTLTPEEFKSVLAHEFSHLSGADAKVGNWIYRIRQTWARVADEIFSQAGWLNAPLRGFFLWFWPHFNARAFLLSRANEYRADAFAATVTSPSDCARALHRIHLESRNLDEGFWAKLQDRLRNESEPPQELYIEMKDFLRIPVAEEKKTKWLQQAFTLKTNNSDTHPSLRDRCAALGVKGMVDELPVVFRTATDEYLGERFAAEVRAHFSKRWADQISQHWKAERDEIEENRRKLRELEQRGIESSDDEWKRITLFCQIDGAEPHLVAARAFAEAHPDHLLSAYVIGSHLLAADNPEGLAYLDRASAIPELALDCMEVMAAFHDRNGDHSKLDGLIHKADEHDAMMERTERIRYNVNKNDTFASHGLSEKRIGDICSVLSQQPEIRKAWLVRRQHEVFENIPNFLLVLEIKHPWFKFTLSSANQQVLDTVLQKLDVEESLIAIDTRGQHKAIRKKVAKIPDSGIYRKAK